MNMPEGADEEDTVCLLILTGYHLEAVRIPRTPGP